MSIADNYRMVEEKINAACARAGRRRDEVTMLAVTKFVPVERIEEVIRAGAAHVGENRVQELMDKIEFFNNHYCDIHFIGQLQTNKVKYIIGKVHMIESVDRLELAREIERLATMRGLVQDVLIEVNIGREEQKGGILEEDLPGFLKTASTMNGLRVKGLMCIPPAVAGEEARPYFARIRALFESLKDTKLPNVSMEHLSMGMSGDYVVAIEEGATIVRVGTGLFGDRQY